MKKKLVKETRLNVEDFETRSETDGKMIIEGYPIVFDKETYIDCGGPEWSWYESVDRKAFENADLSDVCLKYNHNDNILILARTRNNSLTLSIDEHGVFMHAELIDTTSNEDVYKMVKSELLKEGSFAFTIEDMVDEEKEDGLHRSIKKIGKLFDVAICPNGAYGDLTEIYARSRELLENKRQKELENSKRVEILRLKNKNKMKLWRLKNED